MREELDMTGAKRIAFTRSNQAPWKRSLCDTCGYPTRNCRWLLYSKPFEGTEYIERKVNYWDDQTYSVYTITKCPHYEEIKDE